MNGANQSNCTAPLLEIVDSGARIPNCTVDSFRREDANVLEEYERRVPRCMIINWFEESTTPW